MNHPSEILFYSGLHHFAYNKDMHLGASLIAGGLLLDDHIEEVAIQQSLYQKYASWIDLKTDLPPIKQTQDTTFIENILETSTNELHIIGHDIIFAALALQAIDRLSCQLPSTMIDNMSRNFQSLIDSGPGLFFEYTNEQVRDLVSA